MQDLDRSHNDCPFQRYIPDWIAWFSRSQAKRDLLALDGKQPKRTQKEPEWIHSCWNMQVSQILYLELSGTFRHIKSLPEQTPTKSCKDFQHWYGLVKIYYDWKSLDQYMGIFAFQSTLCLKFDSSFNEKVTKFTFNIRYENQSSSANLR